jgi:tryptophan halogenase
MRIVVLGRDAPGWIAALALQRALGPSGARVTALEIPSRLEDSDSYATVPSTASLHALFGFDEGLLAARCGGVPLVGRRFANWARGRAAYVEGFDAAEEEAGGPAFHQYWLRARALGLTVPYEDFSLAAAAAKQGRVPLPETATPELAAGFGWQVDAGRYSGLLKHLALKNGVAHRTGRVAEVAMEGGRIRSIAWESGETFEADLFVDASGAEAILIGRMEGAEFESWRGWLPVDQLLTASAPPLDPLPAFAQVSAFRAGWTSLHPLRDRTGVTAAFAEEFADPDMLRSLPLLAGIGVEGDAFISEFEAGMRPRPWVGNCVALGAAAVRLDPLYPVEIHMAHIAVAQLLAILAPGAEAGAQEEAYNSAFALQARNLRDFHAAHYRLNRRFDEPFWDRARDAAAPESLEEKIAAFSARGEVPVQPGEPLQPDDWATLFLGHGQLPQAWDPRADALPEEELMARLQQRLRDIAALVGAMPTVADYVEHAARPLAERVRSDG